MTLENIISSYDREDIIDEFNILMHLYSVKIKTGLNLIVAKRGTQGSFCFCFTDMTTTSDPFFSFIVDHFFLYQSVNSLIFRDLFDFYWNVT